MNTDNKSDFEFLNIGDAELKVPPIILVDASWSVTTLYGIPEGCLQPQAVNPTIFKRMEDIIGKINATKFRLIFWNSDNDRASQKFVR